MKGYVKEPNPEIRSGAITKIERPPFKFPFKAFSVLMSLVICALCLFICAVPIYLILRTVSSIEKDARAELSRFCKLVSEENYDIALELISSKSDLDEDELVKLGDEVNDCEKIKINNRSYKFNENLILKETYEFDGEISSDSDNNLIDFEALMSKEEGDWKVYNFDIK